MSENNSTGCLHPARLWLMDMTVWVEYWQMQCCGEPFSLGTQVEWTLGPADLEWLEGILDARVLQTVDAAEDHHGGVPEDTAPTRATVTRIAAVYCRFATRPPGSGSPASYPVPGSGVLRDAKSADGWTADRGDERFVGYLVQLKL